MFAPFFVLFGLMAVGYLCRKFDSIDDVKNDGLGSMVPVSYTHLDVYKRQVFSQMG